ncbi:hypothetical protein [Sphingomonas cavernae]|uniref:Tail fiber domain-containing protein n=1 Tax=Sphingomonas cavernae TaxID=2320861 RepID=A0A418WP21_9SPHN|nr:hypothetical protein [Sphingomonas cavernae]RJF92969.1 hypothetical protein D3876_00840 [Sphingomonas cavernae]
MRTKGNANEPGAVTAGDDKQINNDGTVPRTEPPAEPDAPDAPPAPDPATEIAYWGVDPSKLVPMLVLEIQHLRGRIAALESA